MKNIFKILSTLLILSSLAGCSCQSKNQKTSDSESEVNPIIEGVTVTVTYYISFNDTSRTGRYQVDTVKSGEKLTKPANPTTAPLEEFPTFKGWSLKQLINDDSDLWDFDKDIVTGQTQSMYLYGIWVAAGE